MAGSGAGALKGNHQEEKDMSAVEQSKQAVEEKKPEVAPEGVTEAATVSSNLSFIYLLTSYRANLLKPLRKLRKLKTMLKRMSWRRPT